MIDLCLILLYLLHDLEEQNKMKDSLRRESMVDIQDDSDPYWFNNPQYRLSVEEVTEVGSRLSIHGLVLEVSSLVLYDQLLNIYGGVTELVNTRPLTIEENLLTRTGTFSMNATITATSVSNNCHPPVSSVASPAGCTARMNISFFLLFRSTFS